ncbi:MAG TPA: hypothetical protein VNM72_07955 [Blastocatellia bacterium]|nr:hypothetical protein [Blastocatellia bacterium]
MRFSLGLSAPHSFLALSRLRDEVLHNRGTTSPLEIDAQVRAPLVGAAISLADRREAAPGVP